MKSEAEVRKDMAYWVNRFDTAEDEIQKDLARLIIKVFEEVLEE